MTRREFRSLAAPDTVREAIDSLAISAGSERVPLRAAHDRVLAERIDAPIDVPGFDRAAMDGYAVRASETFETTEADPVTLSVGGTVHAGTEPAVPVEDGIVAQVATGAVLPAGADAVIPVEETRETDEGVALLSAVAPGDNVMPRGADIAAGDRTLGPGTRLGPRHMGLLAALGRKTVAVRDRPQVGIVSTGEELVQPGTPLQPGHGQIYDVNSHSIAGGVRAAGGEPAVYETAADDHESLRATLERAAEECDLLCTSGSTSAGSLDLLHQLIEDEGERLVHGVALKPGRPMLVGRIFGTAYVGLPGYPVSALTVFRTFVAPALRNATGRPAPTDATVEATLGTRVRYDGGRLRLLAVGLVEDGTGSFVAYAPAKGSGATTTLGEADGVVRMAPETSLLSPGTAVDVERFDTGDPIPALLGVGEPDPTLFERLDGLSTPRYLSLGPQDARRWYDDDIPDVLVTVSEEPTTGDSVPDDATMLGRWTREWGLVVPEGNPADIDGIAALVSAEVTMANLDDSLAIRRAFDDRLETVDADEPGKHIEGYHRALPGLESAARAVAGDHAAVGLGLRATAAKLGLEFVPVGEQTVTVLADPSRADKQAVKTLGRAVEGE